MPLGHAIEASGLVIVQNAGLDIVCIGRYQAKFANAMAAEQFVVGQDGSGGGCAGVFGYAGAECLVIVKTKPAGRGAVPRDGMTFGVGQQIGGIQELSMIELCQAFVGERDLGHFEAAEMRRDLGQAVQHGHGRRFQYCVRRRRQHTQNDPFG